MPDHVIRRVIAIGKRDGQGRAIRFLNQRGEPYQWTDEVPEDDLEFQGLLDEAEDTSVYPDVSSELLGVALEEQERNFQTITEEPEPDFQDLAEATLRNAGINADAALQRANLENAPRGPAVVEAKDDEIIYEITCNLPDAGLQPTVGDPAVILGDDRNDNTGAVIPSSIHMTHALLTWRQSPGSNSPWCGTWTISCHHVRMTSN
jgi:hypothetical protein